MSEWTLNGCAASSDGECVHPECPQLRDGEPWKSDRHCQLDVRGEAEPAIVAAGGWCAPSETIYEMATGEGSRETMLWRGLVDPTPEELLAARTKVIESWREDMETWAATGAFIRAVLGTRFEGLSLRLIGMHRKDSWGSCTMCQSERGGGVEWPCATMRVVLEDAGIEVPEDLLYEQPAPPVPDPHNSRWPFPANPIPEWALPVVKVRRQPITYGTDPSL